MLERQKLKLASFLYKYAFPVYRRLYFRFKKNKDKHHLSIIGKWLKPGHVVLDIGGNIGFFTKFLAGHVGPNGRVYSFEPDKTNFGHLQNELSGFPNVQLIQKAVAAHTGNLILYTSDLLNVDHRTYEPENYVEKYTVEKTSIDDFVAGKFKVDFVKMDIQGFETEALKGMAKTLDANPGIVLFTEFWPYGLSKAGSSATELFDLLTSHGFTLYEVKKSLKKMDRQAIESMKVEYFTDSNVLVSRKEILF